MIIGGLGLAQLLIWIIVIAGVIAIAFIALRAMHITPPEWAISMLWVVAIVIAAIFCIRLVSSM